MTQLNSLRDVVEQGIVIRSLREVIDGKTAYGQIHHHKNYEGWLKIERKLVESEKAVNLESYLLQAYQFNQRSPREIAEELGIPTITVNILLRQLWIPTRNRHEALTLTFGRSDALKKMSAAKLGARNPMYGKRGRDHPGYGKKPSSRSRRELPCVNSNREPTKEELYNDYIVQEQRTREIAEIYNVSTSTIYGWLKHYEIPIRSRKEALKIRIKRGEFGQKRKIVPINRLRDVIQRKNLSNEERAELLGISPMTFYRRKRELSGEI